MIGVMQNYKTFNSFYLAEPLCKGGSGARELSVFLGICKAFSTRFADAFCVIRKSINY